MEDEEDYHRQYAIWNIVMKAYELTRLLVLAAQLLRDIGLVLAQELGVEADVARSVDAVDIAAGSVISTRYCKMQ